MTVSNLHYIGCVVFSILGFMAHVTNQDVSEIVSPGSGLTFIVYPEVVSRYNNLTLPCLLILLSRIPGAQIWASLFFLMLISLALGSIFGENLYERLM